MHTRWCTLPLPAIALTSGFWADWQAVNRNHTLPHGYRMLEEAGNLQNFRIAAGQAQGKYQGREFLDADVYKWLASVGQTSTLDTSCTAPGTCFKPPWPTRAPPAPRGCWRWPPAWQT